MEWFMMAIAVMTVSWVVDRKIIDEYRIGKRDEMFKSIVAMIAMQGFFVGIMLYLGVSGV